MDQGKYTYLVSQISLHVCSMSEVYLKINNLLHLFTERRSSADTVRISSMLCLRRGQTTEMVRCFSPDRESVNIDSGLNTETTVSKFETSWFVGMSYNH